MVNKDFVEGKWMKDRKVILLTNENFEKEILTVLKDVDTYFLIVLYFGNDSAKNWELLEKTRKYFWKKEKNFYLENVVIISGREYIANDLFVEAVITPNDIMTFDFFSFADEYENFEGKRIAEFVERNFLRFKYSFDLYNMENPWIYQNNGTNILKITNGFRKKILNNFHKIKNIIPEMIISFFEKGNNENLIRIIKLIGADAQLIIAFVNNSEVTYNKRADLFIHIESDEYEKIGTEFINEFIDCNDKEKGLEVLKNFFEIPDKNFDADLFYDEEKEIDSKEEKHYMMEVEEGSSLKSFYEISDDTLLFNYGLKKKYIIKKTL